jgi:hypothetical protein
MFLDEPPGSGYVYLQQGIDAVLPPVEVEVVVSVAPCRWDLYDAIGEGVLGI